jgi:hypothetical protein
MSSEMTMDTTRTFELNADNPRVNCGQVIIDLHETAVVIRVTREDAESSVRDWPTAPIALVTADEEPTWEDAEWQ